MANKEKKEVTKKPGFFSRIIAKFKGVKAEKKKVTWASRKSTFKNFMLVMGVVVAMAVVIGLIDWGLGALIDVLFKAINIPY
ncbi:MAG: preprotein translocase subunit SecE [Clostridia bacterium]|nr:preprotein translocase subunit SecE [Clostridia bacterium]MBQ7789304.1 preprotein translocase subunit SecE [Clostridia bacterium]